jgi:chemotaxis protein methyltransferase CheR
MVNQPIKDETFRQLRDFIYEKAGIFIPDSKRYLIETRLSRRIEENKLKSYEDYLYLLKYSSNEAEYYKLFDAITTNETFFFREPHHFEALTGQVIPAILSRNPSKIRVWSAASSTGEEAYTIAMLLNEINGAKSVKTEIFGSDISNSVLEAAKRGVYSSYAVKNIPDKYFRHFKNSNGAYQLDAAIKAMVKFTNINLIDEKQMRIMKNCDIIFCRNVLIYFDEKAKKKVISLLYDALNPGGYLFIGSSESLHTLTRAYNPVIYNKTVVYQRI